MPPWVSMFFPHSLLSSAKLLTYPVYPPGPLLGGAGKRKLGIAIEDVAQRGKPGADSRDLEAGRGFCRKC
eukprot:954349-Rhodomonas_salina.1